MNINEKLYKKVIQILKKRPECRDSDIKLAFYVWSNQSNQTPKQFSDLNVLNLLSALHKGELYQLSSITRARRMAQSNYTDLRGKKYKDRQEKAQLRVKKFVMDQTTKDLGNTIGYNLRKA